MLLHSAHMEHLFLATWLSLAMQKHSRGEKPCGEVREEASCHHMVQASPLNSSAFMAGFISSGFQVAVLSDSACWSDSRKKSAPQPVAVVSYAVTSWRMTGWHHRLSWRRAALAANLDFCVETITWERMWICTCSRPGGFSGRRLRAERLQKMQHHVHGLYIDRTQLFICICMSIPAQKSLKHAQFSMVHFKEEWHETVSMMVPLKMQLHFYIKSQHIGLGKLF